MKWGDGEGIRSRIYDWKLWLPVFVSWWQKPPDSMISLLTSSLLIKITRIRELNLSPEFLVVVFTLETIAVKASSIQYICIRIETQARQCFNMYTLIIRSWKLVFNSFALIHGISILVSWKSKWPQSAGDNCRIEIRASWISNDHHSLNSYELGNCTCHQDLKLYILNNKRQSYENHINSRFALVISII